MSSGSSYECVGHNDQSAWTERRFSVNRTLMPRWCHWTMTLSWTAWTAWPLPISGQLIQPNIQTFDLDLQTVFHSCQGQVTCPKSRLLAMCGSEIAVLLNRAFWMQIDAKFERWYFKGMIVQLIFSFPYTKAQCVITCFIKCLGYMYFIINKYFKVLHRNPNATEIRGMTSIWFDVHMNMGIILRILLYIIIREF